MRPKFLNILFVFVTTISIAQPKFPDKFPFDSLVYIDKEGVKCYFDVTKTTKKIFLFFDISTESEAEAMYGGTNFVFGEKRTAIFPIYFSGQLVKKPDMEVHSKIAVQLFRTPENSIFKDFSITKNDLPLLVVYNEKNQLCGITDEVQNITKISCGAEAAQIKLLRLKLMTENPNKELLPYAGKEVAIIGEKTKDTVAKVITNKYGDFNVELTNIQQDYLITVNEKNKSTKFVILAKQSGEVVGSFKATDRGFVYRLLATDLVNLPDIAEEDSDLDLTLSQKNITNTNQFVITENLYYQLGNFSLSQSSKETLENIYSLLMNYPQFYLEIVSHTDSQGDDKSNLTLSAKRSESVVNYLIKLGVDSKRLKAVGKGEKEIRNRCKNGVDCSDKEHEYNRRTEFKFTRK